LKSSLIAAISLTAAVLGLAGCAADFNGTTNADPIAVPLGTIQGQMHGGRQPITGARLYVYAAGTGGYGSASKSLLNAYSTGNYPTAKDSNGNYYITTDSNGFFSLSGGV
jgi:hypothetical protein